MINLTGFKVYTPADSKKIALSKVGVIFLESSNNVDWYDALSDFSGDTIKIMYDNNGVIRSFTKDASTLFPVDMNVAEVESAPEGLASDGAWFYNGSSVVPKSYTVEEIQEQAETQRDTLLSVAKEKISILQAKIALGRTLSDEEKTKINSWLDYIDALDAIDISKAPDIDWPETVSVK